MPALKIRKVGRGEVLKKDVSGIQRLLKQHGNLFDPPYTPQRIQTEVDQTRRYRTAVVAEHNGRIVGFARYGHTPYRIEQLRQFGKAALGQERHGYVFSILRNPHQQYNGLGEKLVRKSLVLMRSMKYPNGKPLSEVVMTCHEANKGTLGIGAKLGFTALGRVPAQGRLTHTETVFLHLPLRRAIKPRRTKPRRI